MRKLANKFFEILNLIWFILFHKKVPFYGVKNQKEFWTDRLSEDFSEILAEKQNYYYRELNKFILEKFKNFKSKHYLEVGCSIGCRLNKFASELKDTSFTGIDIGEESINFGMENVVKARNAKLLCASACEMPFADKSVDTVYTIVCLSHIPYSEIGKAMDEIQRVAGENILLIEIDYRPMKFRKKVEAINLSHAYMHHYEKFLNNDFKIEFIKPLTFSEEHPRYTAFCFKRVS